MIADYKMLLALADRCEKATEPARVIDVAIFRAIGAPLPFQFATKLVALTYDNEDQCYYAPIGNMRVRYEPPNYTASLDAAVTLVPEARDASGENFQLGGWRASGVWPKHVRATAWVPGAKRVYAAAPALALCAAALRARAGRLEPSVD